MASERAGVCVRSWQAFQVVRAREVGAANSFEPSKRFAWRTRLPKLGADLSRGRARDAAVRIVALTLEVVIAARVLIFVKRVFKLILSVFVLVITVIISVITVIITVVNFVLSSIISWCSIDSLKTGATLFLLSNSSRSGRFIRVGLR